MLCNSWMKVSVECYCVCRWNKSYYWCWQGTSYYLKLDLFHNNAHFSSLYGCSRIPPPPPSSLSLSLCNPHIFYSWFFLLDLLSSNPFIFLLPPPPPLPLSLSVTPSLSLSLYLFLSQSLHYFSPLSCNNLPSSYIFEIQVHSWKKKMPSLLKIQPKLYLNFMVISVVIWKVRHISICNKNVIIIYLSQRNEK